MNDWRRRLVAATALAVALCALVPPTWAQPSSTPPPAPSTQAGHEVVHSWALAPAGSGDPSQPGNRPNLSYEVAPGSKIDDAVTLFNYGNVQLTFRVYATDAFNNPDGAFDLLPGDRKPTEAGTWVRLPQGNVTVPARSQATMPITIEVPADARPGDHAGAVLASSQAEGTGPDGKVISFDRRTGPRLYVRVAGPLAPELSIERIHTTYRPSLNPLSGTAEVTYRIENTGNVRLSGTHRVSVGGPMGLARKQTAPRRLPELLPGQGMSFTETFDQVAATVLTSTVVAVDPEPAASGEKEVSSVRRRTTTFALPLTLLAIAVVALLLRTARRSLRRHSGGRVVVSP